MNTFIAISRMKILSVASSVQCYLSDLQVYYFMHHIDFENDSVLFYIREADFSLATRKLCSKFSSSCIFFCGSDSDNDYWIELKLRK